MGVDVAVIATRIAAVHSIAVVGTGAQILIDFSVVK